MNTPAVRCGNRLTFYGALQQVFPKISVDWNEETKKQYLSSYYNVIIPAMPYHDNKSIDLYALEDIDNAIKHISRSGFIGPGGIKQRYEDSTIEKLKYLIRVVFEAAAEQYLCANIYEEDYSDPKRPSQRSDGVLLPKSFSITQETRASNLLLSDPMQSGEEMGLALMFCLGLRNNESCGLNFGDLSLLSNIQDFWVIWIYKTTSIDSPELKASGKSKNASRVIPAPKRLVDLIQTRRDAIKAQLPDGTNIDQLPIACKGDNYQSRCISTDLSRAAKVFFDRLGISGTQIYRTFQTMQALQETYETENPRIGEKDPTAYFLRRNFATQMALLGLSRPEIMYVIGHDIEDPTETRNEFLCDDKLKNIKKKMDMRISLCKQAPEPLLMNVPLNSAMSIHQDVPLTLVIPSGAETVKLQLVTKEPADTISLSIHTSAGNAQVSHHALSYHVEATQHSNACSNLRDYLNIYRNAKENEND